MFVLITYGKLLTFSKCGYIWRPAALIYLVGLLVVDGYNSPIFALFLAFSRREWVISRTPVPTKNEVAVYP